MFRKHMNIRLMTGNINTGLLVRFCYTYESGQDAKFPTIKVTDSGGIVINNSYGLDISEGYDRPRVYIPKKSWGPFVTLLQKTVKTISENLYEIFPDINKEEFDIDSRVLETFQTEKACSTAGMTMVPCVYVGEGGKCYPAIRLNTVKYGSCTIPFEDAIAISNMISKIDPDQYSFNLINILSKFK